MTGERFKIYNEETLDTYIEDTQDCYSNGNPKTYWFGENEDFCDLFKKLNELAEENEELKSENKGLQGKASSWKITASKEMMKQSELVKENVELKQFKQNVSGLIDKKLQENTDNDEYARRVKIDLIMELKKELEE